MRVTRTLSLAVLVPLAVVVGPGSALGADDAGQDPAKLLKAAAASLGAVKSYHLTASETDEDGTFRFTADVLASGNADITLRQGGSGTVRLRLVAKTTYLRGDAAYWKGAIGGKDGAAAAKKLAGRWIKAAKSDAKEFAPLFDEVAPKQLASCLVAPGSTGTLSVGKPATVGRTKAQVLVDAGDKPGTAPGRLYLATGDDPLPLRLLQTGKTKPGGKTTKCQDGDDTSTASDFRFSRYGEKLSIRAPKNAITIPSSGGGSTGSTV